jgi:hypothetical protein
VAGIEKSFEKNDKYDHTVVKDFRMQASYLVITPARALVIAAKDFWMQSDHLTTHHSPLTTHHSPLTTHHSPLTTSPLTTHHSPLTLAGRVWRQEVHQAVTHGDQEPAAARRKGPEGRRPARPAVGTQ